MPTTPIRNALRDTAHSQNAKCLIEIDLIENKISE